MPHEMPHPNALGDQRAQDWDRTNWSDHGCNLFPSCLNCPRAKCQYDETPYRSTRNVRDQLIGEMHADGYNAREIAAAVGVSLRTVYRVLGQVAA